MKEEDTDCAFMIEAYKAAVDQFGILPELKDHKDHTKYDSDSTYGVKVLKQSR